jgi:hypothetical protein
MSDPVFEELAKELFILVPTSDSSGRPMKGSGIVGSPTRDGLIKVDYEGNLYHAENLRTFWERLFHAAGRHVTGYPTVAREYAAAGQGFRYWIVGRFNYPEAVERVRSREVSVTEAVRGACNIDLIYKEAFETWVEMV